MYGAFAERWHTEMTSFHFPVDEMTITLDDVAYLLCISIKGRLLDHSRIKHDKAQKMMVIYLGVDPMDAQMQCESTRGAHAKFPYLELAKNADNDDLQVTYHMECALRCFILFLVGMSIFLWTKV